MQLKLVRAATLLLGVTFVVIGLYCGFATVSRHGLTCGSGFTGLRSGVNDPACHGAATNRVVFAFGGLLAGVYGIVFAAAPDRFTGGESVYLRGDGGPGGDAAHRRGE